ncbi:phosphotransferase [Nocardia transvalensis]|uniref:phosphotransferase n=1 Tax=Nocardia transvalensis TaxID=37333 RepID=UPI0018947533|nr:phosphotransferase [Nocardia transvalensis]MBF6331408.1 phosphotransferase [Nocardia transvalensis]
MRAAETKRIGDLLGDTVLDSRALAGGHSHETWLLVLSQRSVVVRLGDADHATEAAVMAAAEKHVPVPAVITVLPAIPADEQLRSAMVLDHVAGTPLSHVLSDDSLSSTDFHRLGCEVGRVAATVGSVRFDRPGFFAGSDLAVSPMPPWSEQLPAFADQCMAATPETRLDLPTRTAWADLCTAHSPALTAVDHHARLVHSDLNPKNLLVTRASQHWQVAAVLDWEFSYSGCPYADAANMARFGRDYPEPFLDGFTDAFADHLPDDLAASADFAYLGRVLDMFAMSDLVTRPPGHPVADRAALQIRQWLATGVPTSL